MLAQAAAPDRSQSDIQPLHDLQLLLCPSDNAIPICYNNIRLTDINTDTYTAQHIVKKCYNLLLVSKN